MSCGCGERGERKEKHCKRIAEEKKLAGAKFELRAKCGCLIACARTNSEGECYFGDLPAGTYMLKEVEAPKGWICEGRTMMIEITDDRLERCVEFMNRKRNGGIKVVKLGREERFACEKGE